MPDLSDLLTRCWLFSDLDPKVLHRVGECGWETQGEAGSPIFYPGDPSNLLYVLLEGRVRLAWNTSEGSRITIDFLTPTQVFGEFALADNAPRQTFAETIDDSSLVVLQANQLEEVFRSNPGLYQKLLRLFARRRRRGETKLRNLLFKNARQRLAYVLHDLFHQYNLDSDGSVARLDYSHQDLAELSGLARPTTTKLLNEFASADIVRLGQCEIEYLDPEALRRMHRN